MKHSELLGVSILFIVIGVSMILGLITSEIPLMLCAQKHNVAKCERVIQPVLDEDL